ncbi:hypothetical protein V12B01_13440 [Vibrio splendidus 12B01]|nr:hypothetical protein V12B01_13440 [Vibrio splendidus 12B01]
MLMLIFSLLTSNKIDNAKSIHSPFVFVRTVSSLTAQLVNNVIKAA